MYDFIALFHVFLDHPSYEVGNNVYVTIDMSL